MRERREVVDCVLSLFVGMTMPFEEGVSRGKVWKFGGLRNQRVVGREFRAVCLGTYSSDHVFRTILDESTQELRPSNLSCPHAMIRPSAGEPFCGAVNYYVVSYVPVAS